MKTIDAQVWADGAMLPFADATIHVLSHATQRGSAVFDVIKLSVTPAGICAIGLHEHVKRFLGSMDLMGMTCPYDAETLAEAVAATVNATPGSTVVKLVAAWAEVPLRTLPLSTTPSVWVAAMLPSSDAPGPNRADGVANEVVRLKTATGPKIPASVLPAELKVAASYTSGVRQRMVAVSEGFDDVLFKQLDGTLAEGTTQSAFVVREGTLLAPPLIGVLDSITRQMMLDVADHLSIQSEIRVIEWDEVLNADELFMCSSNYFALGVAALDTRVYPAPGPVTVRLSLEADHIAAGNSELSTRWLTPLR